MIICGDCLEELKKIDSESVDSLVTDPPAGISFMNADWDSNKGGRKEWVTWMSEVMTECLRVLKPGGHGLVWALPRTSHWTAWALEEAGFEIRDTVCHLFGSGFPKSLNISKAIDKMAGSERKVVGKEKSFGKTKIKDGKTGYGDFEGEWYITSPATPEAKQWEGWGTGLKPAHEIWWLVRKPISEKNIASNVLRYDTGSLNIDASRVELHGDRTSRGLTPSTGWKNTSKHVGSVDDNWKKGRFPANLIHDGSGCIVKQFSNDASRFFYCAKPSVRERNEGLDGFEEKYKAAKNFRPNHSKKAEQGENGNPYGRWGKIKNNHPTLKSIALMEYLIRLITPPKGIVLDPFMGSGTTGCAAKYNGFEFIGIEKEKEYFEIAKARIKHWSKKQKQESLL